MSPQHPHSQPIPPDCNVIQLHLHRLEMLFDPMDPSPWLSKDLQPRILERIVEGARDYPLNAPLALVIYADQMDEQLQDTHSVCDALRTNFAQLSMQARHRLRLHLRRGLISLMIGLTVLACALIGSKLLGEGTIASTLRESLDIGGWVALWRPMEMFLYDWWPIQGDRMRYRKLSRMPIQIHVQQEAPVRQGRA